VPLYGTLEVLARRRSHVAQAGLIFFSSAAQIWPIGIGNASEKPGDCRILSDFLCCKRSEKRSCLKLGPHREGAAALSRAVSTEQLYHLPDHLWLRKTDHVCDPAATLDAYVKRITRLTKVLAQERVTSLLALC
jgi:hypothetical protein